MSILSIVYIHFIPHTNYSNEKNDEAKQVIIFEMRAKDGVAANNDGAMSSVKKIFLLRECCLRSDCLIQ